MSRRRAQVVGPPDAQRQFLSGIHTVANLLAPTLGPLGGHVAGSANASSKTTYELWDDAGTTMRRLISLGTPQQDVGAMLVRGMVWRMEQRLGDGGASAAVLARAIAARGIRLLAAGVNAMDLAKGIRKATEAAWQAVLAQAQPVADEDDLARLADSVTHVRDLSAVLGEICYLLGPEGHVQIEKYVAPYLERRYLAGAHFRAQTASMYFYTDAAKRSAVLTQPAVVLLDEPLTSQEAALALMEAALARKATALLIVAPETSGAALNLLVANQQAPTAKRKLALLAVKLKAAGDERSIQMADLGVLTGAALLGRSGVRPAASCRADDLGRAARAEFAGEGVTLVAEDARRAAVRSEAEALQAHLATVPFDAADRPLLTRRLATLTGGVGELKIGANSQLERDALFETATRALRVLTAAQRTGVVAGAGAALVHALPAVQALEIAGDARMGVQVVAESLAAPLKQIAHNAGVEHPATVVQRVAEAGPPCTYDAYTNSIVDGRRAGVLDAAEVSAAVLVNAASCALMALTTGTIVYHRAPKQSLEP